MTVDMNPARTRAVVVGIERYAAGWQLDGAANDALRAARWLRAAGVKRISLLISALPDNETRIADEATGLGLTTLPADRDAILDLFTKELPEAEEHHLVVFWSGHGILDENHRRALYTADAHEGDHRTLRVDDLLDYLRDSAIRGLHDQVMLVDACANFVEYTGDARLTHATFPRSRPRHSIRQFVLYAAAQGEIAGHNQARKYGEFSEAVFAELHPAAGVHWPPDMPALSNAVAARFDRLREVGYCQATPVYLSRTTEWAGSESGCAYGGLPVSGTARRAASEAGITPAQLRRLLRAFEASHFTSAADMVPEAVREGTLDQLLGELAGSADGDHERITIETIRRMARLQRRVIKPLWRFQAVSLKQLRTYYDVVPDRQLAPQLTELDEVLEYVAEFGETDESAPLYRYVARLEILTGRQIDDDWFHLSPATLARLRTAERRATTAGGNAHLVVHLAGAEWPAEVSGHLRTADGRWTKQTVACVAGKAGARAAANELIAWAHQAHDGELTLGFLVSRARFDDVPERWTFVDELSGELTLAEEYPVVLHAADRMRAPRARRRWEDSVRRITDDLEHGVPEILWLEGPLEAREITKAVLAGKPACVAFADVPGPLRGALPQDPLVAAINPGAPYVIWLEERPDDWSAIRDLIAALVRNGEFRDAPVRALQVRQHTQPGIRMLWDDQDLLPAFGPLTGIEVRTA